MARVESHVEVANLVMRGATTAGSLSDDTPSFGDTLRYAYPLILLAFFLILFVARDMLISPITTPKPQLDKKQSLSLGSRPLPFRSAASLDSSSHLQPLDFSRSRKLLFQWLSLALALTFVADAAVVILHVLAAKSESWWCGQSVVVYIVGTFMVYTLVLLSVLDSKPSPTNVHASTWALGTVLELLLLGSDIKSYAEDKSGNHKHQTDPTPWDAIGIAVGVVRLLLLLALIASYGLFIALLARSSQEPLRKSSTKHSGETSSLLPHAEHGQVNVVGANGLGYGSGPPTPRKAPAGWEKPKTIPERSWWEYVRGYTAFFPYLWPSKNTRLQMAFVAAFLLTVIQRGIQVLVPMQSGRIVDMLSDSTTSIPWSAIALFIFYKVLQGNNGILGAARSMIWLPISQYSYRTLSVASFEHVHSLSLEFHLGKRTGEVLSALGKGNAINNFLENVTFQVLPMLIDLCVAMGYFLIEFDVYYALVVGIVTFWYIYLTIRMARWRTQIRRQMVDADREVDAVKNETMVAYETVKYFNAEQYEFKKYGDAVTKFQTAEYSVNASLNIMNVTQNFVFMAGLMITCFIAAYQVSVGTLRVGNFVTLLTYMAQLQGPLNFFGTFYRMIQSAMINSERMLELFKETPTVVDRAGAGSMPVCQGDIKFNAVRFAYDERKPALEGLDFHCTPGSTTALVGESGGGKSTIFRLLFRFYQATAGSIEVDGNNVEDMTIDSLRRHIGVVPQDTVLFNDTLMYNLLYARPAATEAEVHEACKAASIHDRILSFPDGYQTVVGERGLRLSGGEKQRIAIARTILKRSKIILLDEATAALDSETEEHIQEALLTLGKGRTMLVIAHRLSTITMADQILVVHQGRVTERGSHDELLAAKGRYASMWKKQVRAQRAAEEARLLKDKAQRLQLESTSAMDSAPASGEHSGEHSSGSSEDERSGRAKR